MGLPGRVFLSVRGLFFFRREGGGGKGVIVSESRNFGDVVVLCRVTSECTEVCSREFL